LDPCKVRLDELTRAQAALADRSVELGDRRLDDLDSRRPELSAVRLCGRADGERRQRERGGEDVAARAQPQLPVSSRGDPIRSGAVQASMRRVSAIEMILHPSTVRTSWNASIPQ